MRIDLPRNLNFGALVEIARPEGEGELTFPYTRDLSIVAKTPAPLYFSKVDDKGVTRRLALYFDLAGYRSPWRLSIDHEHDPLRIVGHGEPRLIDGPAIAISGKAVFVDEDCPAYKLAQYADAGVPLQASIAWDPDLASIEEVAAGRTAMVNGQEIAGPALVAREWPLLNVSVVLLGDDAATGAYFLSANMEGQTVSTTTPNPATPAAPETPSTPEKPLTPPAETPTPPGETATPGAQVPSQLAANHGDPLVLVEQFTTKFGAEQGVAFLRQKLSFHQALEADHTRLLAEVVELKRKLAETEARLKAMPVGLQPVNAPTFNTAESREAPKTQLSARERYCQGTKFPVRSSNN